jgi:replication factor A1
VLDDGTETMAVETGAHVQLGEEITVRGRMDGDRLDAEELF